MTPPTVAAGAADAADRGAQAERTTMAWVRTALAVEATAALGARALHFGSGGLALLLVTTLGVAAFVLSALRRLHGQRDALMTGRHRTGRTRSTAPVAVTLAVVTLCGAAATLIVVDGPA